MSYSIGQCRRSQFSNFENSINYSLRYLTDTQSLVDFLDPYLSVTSGLSSLNAYYLRFTVQQMSSDAQKFTIKLENVNSEDERVQNLRTLNVVKGTSSTTFELIFTPNTTYNAVVFELTRTDSDFYTHNDQGTAGRLMDITIEDFSSVVNLVTQLQSEYSGLTSLARIGVQGPPGLIFMLNGEEFRIGKTGVYELYNENVEITSMGFIIKESLYTQDGKDFFLVDFKYAT